MYGAGGSMNCIYIRGLSESTLCLPTANVRIDACKLHGWLSKVRVLLLHPCVYELVFLGFHAGHVLPTILA